MIEEANPPDIVPASVTVKLSHFMLPNFILTVRRCFKMIWRTSYLLVDLLPTFLKTFASFRLSTGRGRHLSSKTTLKRMEIQQLEQLTRDLNALQVSSLLR